MKRTVDIPEKELQQVLKNTGAKNEDEAVRIAVQEFNRRKRLSRLASRLKGSLPNFMTQNDLKRLREDSNWESAK